MRVPNPRADARPEGARGPSRRRLLANAAGAMAVFAMRPAWAAPTPAKPRLGGGVNLAGAEFNPAKTRVNFDYVYPDQASLDYFVRHGFRLFRVPFLAQRVLTRRGEGLWPTGDMGLLLDVVRKAAQRGARVILDMHQYGQALDGKLIGRDPGAVEDFAQCWKEIASRFRGESNVIFGLMNEPNRQSASEWLEGANAAIAAIRAAGARQLVLVAGSYWDSAHSWTTTDNATVMLGVKDPAANFAYEVHAYLDADNSGTHPQAVKGAGSTRLSEFTAWCRQNKVRAVLGEFGWADNPEAHAEGEALLAAMKASPDVWIGWTYWAAGAWWGNYMYSVHPQGGADRPQLAVLKRYLQD